MPAASSSPKDLYAASCNPSRRAKLRSASTKTPAASTVELIGPSTDVHHPHILPKPAQSHSTVSTGHSISNQESSDAPVASASANNGKRGRKPGAMSRSARETQRKLNHSIIEKARRTKINEALSTLKQLVPPDFRSNSASQGRKSKQEDDEDEDGDDGDYLEGKEDKPKGKREEKEKEFKLEILVRTVAYMQFLIQKIGQMDQEIKGTQCKTCRRHSPTSGQSLKRKRGSPEDEVEVEVVGCDDSNASTSTANDYRSTRRRIEIVQTSRNFSDDASQGRNTLPSISSWLPSVPIDPSLLPPNESPSAPFKISSVVSSHLLSSPRHHIYPSPPSSTTFTPFSTHQLPPVLSLPAASKSSPPLVNRENKKPEPVIDTIQIAHPNRSSRSLSLSSTTATVRTPEEESAASLLLQIRHGSVSAASSPAFGPVLSTSPAFGHTAVGLGMMSPAFGPSASPTARPQTSGAEYSMRAGVNDAFQLDGREEQEREMGERNGQSTSSIHSPSQSTSVTRGGEARQIVALTPSSMLGMMTSKSSG